MASEKLVDTTALSEGRTLSSGNSSRDNDTINDEDQQITLPRKHEDLKEKLDRFSKLDESFLQLHLTEQERKTLDERLGLDVTLVHYFRSAGTDKASESLKKALGIGQPQISSVATSPRSIKFDDQKRVYSPPFGKNWHENQPRQQQRTLPSEPPYFIYVSNIAYNANMDQIKEYFGGDKNVRDIYMYKYGNGNFAGDCFLELVNCRKALDYVVSLNHKQFIHRLLTISPICDDKSRRFSLNAMAENYKSRFIPVNRLNRSLGERKSSLSYRGSPTSPRRSPFSKSPSSPRRYSFSSSQDVRRMAPRYSSANVNRSLYSTPPAASRQISSFYSNNRGYHRPIDIPSPRLGNHLKENMSNGPNSKDYESKRRNF